MVGLDETNNLAYFGGCTINERWEDESVELDHFVFVTNVIDYLHDSSDPSGPVADDGVVNPDTSDYFATETLAGDDPHSVDTEFVVE